MASTLSRRKPGSNVWRQWRAKRVHCTPGLGARVECASSFRASFFSKPTEDKGPAKGAATVLPQETLLRRPDVLGADKETTLGL
jgi:hypothetical protein